MTNTVFFFNGLLRGCISVGVFFSLPITGNKQVNGQSNVLFVAYSEVATGGVL